MTRNKALRPKAVYIAITDEQDLIIQALQEGLPGQKKMTLNEILEKGLENLTQKVPKKLIEKVKALVKENA